MFIKPANYGGYRDPDTTDLPSFHSTTMSEDGERVRFDTLEYKRFNQDSRDYNSMFPRYFDNTIGLVKSSYAGKRYGPNTIIFDQYYYSEYPMVKSDSINLNRFDGLVKDLNSNDCQLPDKINIPPMPVNTREDDYNKLPVCKVKDLKHNTLKFEPIHTMGDFIDNIEVLESDLQVSYMHTFGLLEIPMIAMCENYPMYANLVFDSDLGDNGKYKTLKSFQNNDLLIKSLNIIENIIDDMFDIFKGYCQIHNLHLRLYVHITPFNITTSGSHKSHPDKIFIHKYSLIDSMSVFKSLENVYDYVDGDIYASIYRNFTIPWRIHDESAADHYMFSNNYQMNGGGYGYSHVMDPIH